jgi:hypothetical protein
MTAGITLMLTHSPAPGVQWEYEVHINETAAGHRVMCKDRDTGRMMTVRRSKRALSWRVALADIEATEATWLWIDERDLLSVTGLCEWQADVLRLAACKSDRAPSEEAGFLLRLDDLSIEQFVNHYGRLIASPAIDLVRELIEIYLETGAIKVIGQQIKMLANHGQQRDPDQWVQQVREACLASPGAGPSLRVASAVADADALRALANGPRPRIPAVRAILFRKWVEFLLPTTFKRTTGRLGEQPELVLAEWILAACARPGEIADAAESDPALLAAVEQFRAASDAFLAEVGALPAATSYGGGIAQSIQRLAATHTRRIQVHVLGERSSLQD